MTETTTVTTTCPNQHTEDCHNTTQTYQILTAKILELNQDPDRVREWLFAPTEGLCAWCEEPLEIDIGTVAFSGP